VILQTSISCADRGSWIASCSARGSFRTLALLAIVSLTFGCGHSAPPSPPAAESAAPPASAPLPVPSFSAAQKVGMFVFAQNNQNHDQQLRDELDCYNQVQQQTGIAPDSPPPQPPSSAQVQAAQQQAVAQTPEAEGGRARGAARGAVGGAVVGGIAGDAGKGAAIGAAAGTVHGGRKQKAANDANQQQAAQSASAQLQQQYQQAQAAYGQQQDTFKRGLSACLDSRGYSVK
jgi:Glycine-zipper domain